MPLERFFKPEHFFSLKRLGSKNDGGYLIGINSIQKAEILISFGINDDWSFENSIKKIKKGLAIFCYDDQLCFKYLLKNFLIQLVCVIFNFNIKLVVKGLKALINYYFFINKVNYFKKRITNRNIRNIFLNKKNILLKIDIEGSEYRILEQIIKIQNKLTGLIIEFHDIDLHKKLIESFIKKLNLKLVHVHGNNYSKPDNFDNPTILELTFEKKPIIISKKSKIPHPLDRPNNEKKKDFILKFK